MVIYHLIIIIHHHIERARIGKIDFPTTYFWKAWLPAYLHVSISVLRLPHGVSGLCSLLTRHATLWLAAGGCCLHSLLTRHHVPLASFSLLFIWGHWKKDYK
jgi:hypothetical protein